MTLSPHNSTLTWEQHSNRPHPSSHKQVSRFDCPIGEQNKSFLFLSDQDCYEAKGGCFSVYGFEYAPGEEFNSDNCELVVTIERRLR
jgi:hypothetical protein